MVDLVLVRGILDFKLNIFFMETIDITETCIFCDGKGKIKKNDLLDCPACWGWGTVTIRTYIPKKSKH
jgi:DnaJ-class molecular chaperone